MYGFDFHKFKSALKKVEEENHSKLQQDLKEVKAFVEKVLTYALESTASRARTNYAGLDMH